MGQLEVIDVRLAGPPVGRVKGFCIDAPGRGVQAGGALRISGWVVEQSIKITGVVVFCQGTVIRSSRLSVARADAAARYPGSSEQCGFNMVTTPIELPAEFELTVVAVCADHGQYPLAIINGRHGQGAAADGRRKLLQPLMVTSLGRSGTTYLMKLLSNHPRIVADRLYPYEANAARYWMHTMRVLTQPPVPGRIGRPFDLGDFEEPPFVEAPIRTTPALAKFIETGYAPIAAEFACRSTDAFYRQIADANGQTNPIYFCEKVLPSGLRFMLWNLYGQAREIFLVRDFRDVACSVFAFNAKRGSVGFGRASVATDEEYIGQLRQAARNLLETYRGGKSTGLLVRYEDLIHKPTATLGEILRYLNLDADTAAVEAMRQAGSQDTPELEKHRTAASPEASIGRWRQDMEAGLQELCKKSFADMLPSFGYKLDKQGALVIEDSELVAK